MNTMRLDPKTKVMTFNEFWNLPTDEIEIIVKEEAKSIKHYFPKEEIDRLEVRNIDGDNVTLCIYGHMAGNCNSERVGDFIRANVKTVITQPSSKFKTPVNRFDPEDRSFSYFLTALEEYITPFDKDQYYDEEVGVIYGESYYERISKVLNWIKNED